MASVKMTGEEYNAFIAADCWGEDWYWDETLFRHNGDEVEDIGECEPTDEVVILSGTIYKGSQFKAQAIDAVTFARKWLKSLSVVTVYLEVPRDTVVGLKDEMKSRGIRIIGVTP